jgi:hypothetical protein
MNVRTFQPGDDAVQVSIYNEAAATLPKFKAATLDELRRRTRGPDFDPSTRFYVLEQNRPVAYGTFQANGRLSYPWCRPGHEALAGPLLEHVVGEMKRRGLTRAFAAYRDDWPAQAEFFLRHGFRRAREMVNFVLELVDMPTPAARPSSSIGPLTPDELPAVLALCPGVLRVRTVEELRKHLFENPYFPAESCVALRGKGSNAPVAVGVLVCNPSFGDPKQVDSAMPCFRLGAFGTEGLTTKRLNGLFSFLTGDHREVNCMGLDLLGYAVLRLVDTDLGTLAAQVPSDAAHLLRFYQQYFRRQGSFPIFERSL